ncbi:VOC family protein [Halomonas organivorans]|uniref:Putative enzyme related to lactoylglutathione lyase n=1 Tax=Halomonas organivorans TaxID=257772 RepID=A0A7W5G553_9GAMM|nr:VOC family protein [Halomonas organivorans]MBB3141093.1 putative enzyme related to lactoylglutathione lyase [Halomonas organivorans]
MKILINIDVPELAPAIAFYCTAFGLVLGRELDDDVAELTGAEARIYLLRHDSGSPCAKGSGQHRDYARHWTPVHFDVVVDDIDQATARVLGCGAVQESECVHWQGSTCVTFSDPFGHGFCLIEFSGEGYRDDRSSSC